MYFQFTAEERDFEAHITDQTLLSVMAVRMWSYLTLILTKWKSRTVPLMSSNLFVLSAQTTAFNYFITHTNKMYNEI